MDISGAELYVPPFGVAFRKDYAQDVVDLHALLGLDQTASPTHSSPTAKPPTVCTHLGLVVSENGVQR